MHGIMRILVAVLAMLMAAAPALGQPHRLTIGKPVNAFHFLSADAGEELGIWKKHNVDLKVLTFRSGAAQAQAFAAGDLDLIYNNGFSTAGMAVKGVPVKVVASIANRPTGMVLLVGKESGIAKAADLKGKTIGVTGHGALTDLLARTLAARNGWNPDTELRRAPLGGWANQLAALKRGEIVGFVWSVEGGFDFEEQGLGRSLIDFGDVAGEMEHQIVAAHQRVIDRNPEALRAFLAGLYETIRTMKARRDYSVDLMVRKLGITKVAAERTFDFEMAHLSGDGRLSEAGLKNAAQTIVELGMAPVPPAVPTFVDPRFVPVP